MWPFKSKPATVETIQKWAGKGKYEKIEHELQNNPDRAVRLAAAQVFAELDHAMTRLEPLVTAVEDTDEQVREVGLKRLGWTLYEVVRLSREPIETPPGLALRLDDLASNQLVAAAIGDDRAMDSLSRRAFSGDRVATFQWQFAHKMRLDMTLKEVGRRVTAALERTAPRRIETVVTSLTISAGASAEETVAALESLVDDFAGSDSARRQAAGEAAQALIRGEDASVVLGPYLRSAPREATAPTAPPAGQSTTVPSPVVTDCRYWRCPSCHEILEKAALGTVWRAGESLDRVQGEATCSACGERLPQADIYSGRHDFRPTTSPETAGSPTTLRDVSLVVFREGEDTPADPEGQCREILERKFTGQGTQVKTWRIVGVKEAVRDPDHACVLYARLGEQGQLPRLGDPFDEFQGTSSDGRKVVALFFRSE